MTPSLSLHLPAHGLLDAYADACLRGWEPVIAQPGSGHTHIQALRADPNAFLAWSDDPLGLRPPVAQPDGSLRPALPSTHRWIFIDDAFVGAISLRWQPGTPNLPPWVLGHLGWNVVPWARGLGTAPRALHALLPKARDLGLPWVDLAIRDDNPPSQRAALRAGAHRVGPWVHAPETEALGPMHRWRVLVGA